MIANQSVYCLDANVLIQAWQKYWSPRLCPAYWELLNQLGSEKRVFLPEAIYDEIITTEDKLAKWLQQSKIPVHPIDAKVSECLKKIYAHNPSHQYIVSSNGVHSAGDPWVIAHAMNNNATVVTKEIKDVYTKPTKIKIPHVCDNMGIRWINDFQFVEELEIEFFMQL
jgi:predicted nucleic acid-binding protein